MRRVNEAVSVFFSTTNDDRAAERKDKFEKVCKQVEISRKIAIHKIHWQDNIPGGVSGETGQTRINAEVKSAYDIYFGCLGTKYGKGTVEEFENALKGYMLNDLPSEVLFGFEETKVNPYELPDDFKLVREFRTNVQSAEKYGRSILYFSFVDMDEFYQNLFRDLNTAVERFQSKIKGGSLRV